MIYALLAEGFEEIEALTPVDMLRRAGLEVKTVGIASKEVTGSHGITVVSDITPEEIGEEITMLILPGGMPGSANLDAWEQMDALLARTLAGGGRVAAICAAPMVLGKRGYLQGKHAVCYPGFEEYLEGATVTDARVERDGKVITSKGMGAALEFGLALVEVLCGKEKAEQIAGAVFAK